MHENSGDQLPLVVFQSFGSDLILSEDQTYKIKNFIQLVRKWNGLNLVAKNTLDDILMWHILDGLSIYNLVTQNYDTIIDFGAGGGVVGIPLSYVGVNVILVERSLTKVHFLKDIAKYENVETNLDFVKPGNNLAIIRGVGKVQEVLDMLPLFNNFIFFKAYHAASEVTSECDVEIYPRKYVHGIVMFVKRKLVD